MTVKDNGKYVHLGNGYDRHWLFIEDDKELAEWLKDGSLDEDEFIVEIKKIFKIKKDVVTTLRLEEVVNK